MSSVPSSEVENIYPRTTEVPTEVDVTKTQCKSYSGIYAEVESKKDLGLQLGFQSV